MQVKVSTLSGIALDWAVAHSAGYTDWDSHTETFMGPVYGSATRTRISPPEYSTDWSLGGEIIECEKIEITPWGVNGEWRARDFYEPSPGVPCAEEYGPTPLIAAMRCYVTSKLGEEVEIPDELL
jgi:hypothetical protein